MRRALAIGLAATLAVLGGCTGADRSVPSTGGANEGGAGGVTAGPVSIPALIDTPLTGSDLTLGAEGASTASYREFAVTYLSQGLTISGLIDVPRSPGRHPGVVVAHGNADMSTYDNTQQMRRERDTLAEDGYVALMPDYRNFGHSSVDPDLEQHLRLGFAMDLLNAGRVLKTLPAVDPTKVSTLGHSTGGGVILNALVIDPGMFTSAVAFAPISSNAVDNFEVLADKRGRADPSLVSGIVAQLGEPAADPQGWAQASARTFFSRITAPLLIFQGLADKTVPVAWTQATVAALQKDGKSVDYVTVPGQGHTFGTAALTTALSTAIPFMARHDG